MSIDLMQETSELPTDLSLGSGTIDLQSTGAGNMASIIRIKRSLVSGNPTTLAAGELAYSGLTDNGSNGGDRLYIGMGTETSGNAANHIVIGGKYFTDLLDHTAGQLTASSALIVDSNSKLNQLNVDNITIDGNTISSTNSNGNIILDPNGTGSVEVVGDLSVSGTINATITGSSDSAAKWTTARDLSLTGDATATLSAVDGTANVSATLTLATVNSNTGSFGSSTAIPVITVNGKGLITAVTTESISTTLSVGADTGTTDSVSLGVDTLTFTGGEGIDTSVTNNTITISAEDASDTNKGIASFDATDFTVTSGDVTINAERIEDIVGGMVSTNTESGISVTYDDTNGKLDFDVNDPVITLSGDISGSATMTNLGDTTITSTLATVNSNTGSFGSSTSIPVITVNGKGLITAVTTESISTSFTINGDSGTDTFSTGGTLTFTGTNPVQTAITDNTITISVDDATTSAKGVAQFSSDNFAVSSGTVTIKDGGVANAELANSSLTIGSTSISLGATANSLADLQSISVDNITIDGNEISSTDSNGNISLNPNGTGTVDVNNARITSVGTPTQSTDAVNKAYVDSVAEGLSVKPTVRVATTADLGATYDNGTDGVGSTLTIPATATLTIDGVSDWSLYDGILVKDQTNAEENGRYFVSTVGNVSTAWVLTRCTKCDEPSEIPSMYVFVQEGTLYNSTGWVATVDTLPLVVGTDDIVFVQFSGAGTYLAGDALGLTGSTFNVLVAASGGLEISADALQIKSTLAGDGLSYASGVLAVGGTSDRITVSSDSVDIAATYVGQSSITTLGTISTGVWQGTVIGATYGGTGVNNGSNTITLGGNVTTAGEFITSGANSLTLTTTGTTNVTLPTTGTLATIGGTETLTNKTLTSPTVNSATISGGTINNASIGATTASSGAFTTLSASGNTTLSGNLTGSGTSVLSGFDIDGGTY